MRNLGQMMRQAQEMQARMAEMQERIFAMEITGQAGGGMVTMVITGKGHGKRLTIDPKLLAPTEKETLEDLVIAALNDGRRQIEALVTKETEQLMGGMPMPPGFKLPV